MILSPDLIDESEIQPGLNILSKLENQLKIYDGLSNNDKTEKLTNDTLENYGRFTSLILEEGAYKLDMPKELSGYTVKAGLIGQALGLLSNNIVHHCPKFIGNTDENKIKIEASIDDKNIYIRSTNPGAIPDHVLTGLNAGKQTTSKENASRDNGNGLITFKKLLEHYNGDLNISNDKVNGNVITEARIPLLK